MSCNVRIFGVKGSSAIKGILEGTDIKRYVGGHTDVLINYGASGMRLQNFYAKFPPARHIPTINPHVGHSKLRVIRLARDSELLVPDSKLTLGKPDNIGDWIEKRIYSQGGYGIRKARNKLPIDGKYYQKFIKNRDYELRVHAFLWMNMKQWHVQKRFGSKEEIAWNYANGGYFESVYNTQFSPYQTAINETKTVLRMLGMAFGASDFIVDTKGNVYFIEINSCPGFQELSKGIYVDAFDSLKAMSLKEVLKFT